MPRKETLAALDNFLRARQCMTEAIYALQCRDRKDKSPLTPMLIEKCESVYAQLKELCDKIPSLMEEDSYAAPTRKKSRKKLTED